MLAFAAEHRFVLAAQLAALLQISTDAAGTRLRALADAGYLADTRPLNDEPTLYQATTKGVRATGGDLRRPEKIDLARFRHDAGLAWLMVGAERGMFGPLDQIVSERRMRSEDRRSDEDRDTFGVPLRGGRGGLHYPDMLVVTDTGHRIAFELELSGKSRARREAILSAYGADQRIDAVVYLVDNPARRRAIEQSVRRVGVGDRVRVEPVTVGHGQPAPSDARTSERTAQRGRAGADR